MKKILLGIVVLGLLVVVVVVGAGFYLVNKISTPEFKASLVEEAKKAAGTNVEVKSIDISLLSGVTLKGLKVDNPPPFTGPFLTAEEFVLRYKLGPLMSGRVEVEELSLTKPVIAMSQDKKGAFNYEKLGGGAPAAPAKTGTTTTTTTSSGSSVPLDIHLNKLAVNDLDVVMTDANNLTLMKVEKANFDSSFQMAGGKAGGKGEASIKTLNMADMLFLRDMKTTLDASTEAVKLAPLKAKLAGGDAGGDIAVNLKPSMKYVTHLEVKGADIKTLIAEAKSAGGIEGKLQAKATFEGTGGMETMKGKGKAEITSCKITNSKVLGMIS
jgi:uncharacterized protein involved in outer membrane biogenesis